MEIFGILFSVILVALLPAVIALCANGNYEGHPDVVRHTVKAFTTALIAEFVGGYMGYRLFTTKGSDSTLWMMGWVFLLLVSIALPIAVGDYYGNKKPKR